MWNPTPYVFSRLGLIAAKDWFEKYEVESAKADIVGLHVEKYPERLRAQKAQEFIRNHPEQLEQEAIQLLRWQRAIKNHRGFVYFTVPLWTVFMLATASMVSMNWEMFRHVFTGIVRP